MFTSACEALYLADDRAFEPWRKVIELMEVPGAPRLVDDIPARFPSANEPVDFRRLTKLYYGKNKFNLTQVAARSLRKLK